MKNSTKLAIAFFLAVGFIVNILSFEGLSSNLGNAINYLGIIIVIICIGLLLYDAFKTSIHSYIHSPKK